MERSASPSSLRARAAPGLPRWLPLNPDKRRTELAILLYSPLWMAAIAIAMFAVDLSRWGDLEHMVFGLALGLPPWLLALRRTALHARRFMLIITVHAFVQCYFGSLLFFDAFGMQYHFKVSAAWTWNGTPLFLYFVTIAYFVTYYVLMSIAWRLWSTRFPDAPRALNLLVRAMLCYVIAFAETATMANAALSDFFSYRDPAWVLRWGSICYGTLFFLTLPQLARLDEDRSGGESTRLLVRDALAANLGVLICYEVYGWAIRKWVAGA